MEDFLRRATYRTPRHQRAAAHRHRAIGSELEPTKALFAALIAIGYRIVPRLVYQ